MAQKELIAEGAFTQELKNKVNENFKELYGSSGTFTLNETTPVTVANPAVTADSLIIITLKTVGGTVGAHPSIKTITPGTGFTVAGSASDTSVFNYRIIS
jgi:hypothetical protein